MRRFLLVLRAPWFITVVAFALPAASISAPAAAPPDERAIVRAVEDAEAALHLEDDSTPGDLEVLTPGESTSLGLDSPSFDVVVGSTAERRGAAAIRYTEDRLDADTVRLTALLSSAASAPPLWTFPAGTQLVLLDDGRVSVADSDGELIAGIAAPWAVDAVGQRVPTGYRVDGNVLQQVVHIDDDTRFPVVADPKFTQFPGYWTATLNRTESASAVGTVGTCAAVFQKSPVPALRALTITCGALAAFSAAQLAGGKCVKVHVAGFPPVAATWWPTFPKC